MTIVYQTRDKQCQPYFTRNVKKSRRLYGLFVSLKSRSAH